MSSSLLLRVLSALVLMPIAVLVFWIGGWWFVGFVALVVTLATWEYLRMLARLDLQPAYPFAIALGWLVILFFFWGEPIYLQHGVALLFLGSLTWHVFADQTEHRIENWLLPLAGALFISWAVSHALLIRQLPRGFYRLLATLVIVWSSDTMAYVIGSTWGKHHMLPRISPKKTWEGYAAQVASGTLAGALMFGLGGLGWGHGVALGLIVSLLMPIGDLGISMIKRQAGVKDSGHLIPGHGGLLDRIDTILVAVVLAYYYQVWAMPVS